jgi:hypothetical protein
MKDGIMMLMRVGLLPMLVVGVTAPALGQLNATDWFDVDKTLYNQERYSDSIQSDDNAIKIDSRFAEAWNNKGIDLGMLGEYE